MKVVHLNTNVRWGGGEHQVLELIRGMRDRDHEAVLLARPEGELFERASATEGLEVHPFGFRSRYNPLTVLRLRRLVCGLGADLLHMHDGHAVALGIPAAHRIPDLGLVIHRRISSPMRRSPLSRARYRSARVDAFIAVSGSARGSLLDIAVDPTRMHLVPSGVDAERLRPVECRSRARRAVELPDGVWIGTVGTLERKKDVATFVRMATLLGRRDRNLRFLIVGDGSQREELERMARASGLGSRLIFTGRVLDAHRYIAAMDVFVFPSLREGSPGVVKEAMALGVPVVAADAPGTMEVIQDHTGLRVAPGDEHAFAETVAIQLADPTRARERATRARLHVEQHFSIERTVERTLEVYRGVLAGRVEQARAAGRLEDRPADVLRPEPPLHKNGRPRRRSRDRSGAFEAQVESASGVGQARYSSSER